MYMYMYSPLFVFSEKRIVMASPTSYAGSLSSGSEAITDTTLIFSEPKDPSSTWHNNSQVNATVIVHGQLSGERRCFETFYRAHHIGRCSTPQHTATHCNTLQHTLQRICLRCCTGLIMSDGSLLPSAERMGLLGSVHTTNPPTYGGPSASTAVVLPVASSTLISNTVPVGVCV